MLKKILFAKSILLCYLTGNKMYSSEFTNMCRFIRNLYYMSAHTSIIDFYPLQNDFFNTNRYILKLLYIAMVNIN